MQRAFQAAAAGEGRRDSGLAALAVVEVREIRVVPQVFEDDGPAGLQRAGGGPCAAAARGRAPRRLRAGPTMPDTLLALFNQRDADIIRAQQPGSPVADEGDSRVGIVLGGALPDQLRQRLRLGAPAFGLSMRA